ncbi:MAG: carboxypeptidase-like regulatory domain-containing protein, partial [Prevotella sp.]|nr:carboxypeptidase-like regulatory domain-containing protein [Prevotella sp.]
MNEKMKTLFQQTNRVCLRRVFLMLVVSLLSIAGLYAQSMREISGTVSSVGEPLIGASVVEKGTTNGTLTDIDGKFTLNVKESATIEISYIGFTSKTMSVGQQTVFNIELEEEANILNEVVAIGYGVQKKKLNTGATVQVKGDDLAKLNTTNPLQALQGQSPGVQISSTSGQPGADMKVTVRGL